MAAASMTTEILRPVFTGMRIRGIVTPETSSSSALFPDGQRSYAYHNFPNKLLAELVKNLLQHLHHRDS